MIPAYRDGVLHLEGVSLAAVAARHGTPCYVYSWTAIEERFRAYEAAFGARPHRVCYAVKANDNLSLLQGLARLGAGFDIVSGGELARVLAAGGAAADVVFSGVGKRADEIVAAVAAGVGCINVESAAELERVAAAAGAARREVAVAVRVNPDVDPITHPYIATGLKENKFGVPIDEAPALYERIAGERWLRAHGLACHIGSQLTSVEPVVVAVNQVVALAERLAAGGIRLAQLDLGGGLGIRYQAESPPTIPSFVAALLAGVPAHYRVALEPGRSLVGEAGVLLTRIEYVKDTAVKRFAIVDAAMNDLLRPALYEAWHDVVPVVPAAAAECSTCDVVGPVCESGDWLARARSLPARPGELLAILNAGAYGFAMASNYNARPRPAEVLVAGEGFRLVRPRETMEELLARERACLLP